jgi:hypothetical protein
MINATIQQGVWTEIWVPMTAPGQQVQSVSANGQQHSFSMATDSNGNENVVAEGFDLNPGDQVSLTIDSTLSGFVYQSDQPGYDIVTFAPDTWDMPITDTQVKFYLPGNISTDQVFTGTGLPQYNNIGVENNQTWVYFQNTNLASNAQFMVAVSFPDSYMVSGAAVAGNSGAGSGGSGAIGTGGILSTLISLACPGAIVLVVIIGLIGSIAGSYMRQPYSSPVVKMDGIGVNKDLDPVEAATLLRIDPKRILTMIMFGMMKKGNVKLLSTDPIKLQLVSSQGVNYYEKLFADAIVDDKLNEDKLLDCFKVIARRVIDKTRPFSRKDTEDYYRSKINEAWQQIQAVDTPELKLEKYDTNMIWLMADDQFTQKTTDYIARAPGSSTFNVPTYYWWYPYYFGLPRYGPVGGPVGVGVPQQSAGVPAPAGTAKPQAPTNQTTASMESFAKSITHSVETTSAGVVGSVDGFLGVRNQANAPAPKQAFKPSSSVGGGRSVHSSCACVSCACACAHCACACACAGGGHGCT